MDKVRTIRVSSDSYEGKNLEFGGDSRIENIQTDGKYLILTAKNDGLTTDDWRSIIGEVKADGETQQGNREVQFDESKDGSNYVGTSVAKVIDALGGHTVTLEDPNVTVSSVKVTIDGYHAGDNLTYTGTDSNIYNANFSNGVLTLTSKTGANQMSASEWTEALKHISFSTTANEDTVGLSDARHIGVSVSGNNADYTPPVSAYTINLVAPQDAVNLAWSNSGDDGKDAGSGSTAVFSGLSISDVDNPSNLTTKITLTGTATGDSIQIGQHTDISVDGLNASNLVLHGGVATTQVDWQNALSSLSVKTDSLGYDGDIKISVDDGFVATSITETAHIHKDGNSFTQNPSQTYAVDGGVWSTILSDSSHHVIDNFGASDKLDLSALISAAPSSDHLNFTDTINFLGNNVHSDISMNYLSGSDQGSHNILSAGGLLDVFDLAGTSNGTPSLGNQNTWTEQLNIGGSSVQHNTAYTQFTVTSGSDTWTVKVAEGLVNGTDYKVNIHAGNGPSTIDSITFMNHKGDITITNSNSEGPSQHVQHLDVVNFHG